MLSRNIMLAALAAGATILASTAAEARRHTTPQQAPSAGYVMTNDGRYEPAQAAPAHQRMASRGRPDRDRGESKPAKPSSDAGHEPTETAQHPGLVRSKKTGATAHMSGRFAPIVQAIVDDLEQNHGATIKFIGGWRRGHCSLSSQHPCGDAADICQLGRGVVDQRCHLPMPSVFHRVARAHGAYEGSVWCNGDFGHIQRRDSGGCNGVAHGRGGQQLATITGNMVSTEEISVRRIEPHRRHPRRVAHRHRHKYAQAG